MGQKIYQRMKNFFRITHIFCGSCHYLLPSFRASKDDESFDGFATNVRSKQIDEPKSYHQDDDARITPLKTNKNISKI